MPFVGKGAPFAEFIVDGFEMSVDSIKIEDDELERLLLLELELDVDVLVEF